MVNYLNSNLIKKYKTMYIICYVIVAAMNSVKLWASLFIPYNIKMEAFRL